MSRNSTYYYHIVFFSLHGLGWIIMYKHSYGKSHFTNSRMMAVQYNVPKRIEYIVLR